MYVFNIPTEYKEFNELNEQELEEYTRAMQHGRELEQDTIEDYKIMEYVDGDADATTIEEVEEAMKLDDRVKEVARAMEISNKAIKLCIEESDDQELEKKFKTLVAYLKCKEYIK
tara:strand:- start:352 stop:696 length:345 start_codon:yes stop_codon:yes gene_type:complete